MPSISVLYGFPQWHTSLAIDDLSLDLTQQYNSARSAHIVSNTYNKNLFVAYFKIVSTLVDCCIICKVVTSMTSTSQSIVCSYLLPIWLQFRSQREDSYRCHVHNPERNPWHFSASAFSSSLFCFIILCKPHHVNVRSMIYDACAIYVRGVSMSYTNEMYRLMRSDRSLAYATVHITCLRTWEGKDGWLRDPFATCN